MFRLIFNSFDLWVYHTFCLSTDSVKYLGGRQLQHTASDTEALCCWLQLVRRVLGGAGGLQGTVLSIAPI